ncbi:MAG: hypothetical protein AB4040_01295 [Synechococcus sp.]
MAARERIYDYSIAEELPDGTVRYLMEDQWQAAHVDYGDGQEDRDPLCRGQLEKHFQVVGKVLWLVVKGTAILSWHVLRIAWKVLRVVVFVFCFQSLMGSAITLSRK